MLLQQVAKAKDLGLVRQSDCTRQERKLPIQRPLLELFLHRQIAQVPPQLQAVNAHHGLHRKRRAITQRLVRATGMRREQRHQLLPSHHLVHLLKENLLAGLLVQRVKGDCDLVHGSYLGLQRLLALSGVVRGFADLP